MTAIKIFGFAAFISFLISAIIMLEGFEYMVVALLDLIMLIKVMEDKE